MSYKNEIFTARLDEVMQKDDRALPLLPGALNDLKALLSDDGDYTFASIRSDAKYEAVKIMNVDGLLVVDRGIEGTEPLRHPYGPALHWCSPHSLQPSRISSVPMTAVPTNHANAARPP